MIQKIFNDDRLNISDSFADNSKIVGNFVLRFVHLTFKVLNEKSMTMNHNVYIHISL